jgi:hypothetical protein
VLSTEIERYPGGYGYLISSSGGATAAKANVRDFLTKYHNEIQWTVDTFAHRSASDLELISTVIFTFNEGKHRDDKSLITLVRAVKPHFSESEVQARINWLKENGLLQNQTVPA